MEQIKVLYAGGIGATIALTVSSAFVADLGGISDVTDWGRPFIDTLQQDVEIKVTRMSSWEAY